MPFHFKGHTEDGAPIVIGDDVLPPAGEWVLVLILGAGLTFGLTFGGLAQLFSGNILIGGFGLAIGSLVGGAVVKGSLWWLRLRSSLQKCTPIEVIAKRLGISNEDARKQMRRDGVNVEAVVNNSEMYDLANQDGRYHLLTPAESDANLLIPSHPTPNEQLPRPLRASNTSSDTQDLTFFT